MKSSILLWLAILVAWMAGSEYVWLCKVKQYCSTPGQEHFSTKDDAPATPDRSMNSGQPLSSGLYRLAVEGLPGQWISARSGFGFAINEASGSFGDPGDDFWSRLAAHMQRRPDVDLEITAQYLDDEQNTTRYSNLGLGRAAFVAEQLQKLGISENRLVRSFRRLGSAQDSAPATLPLELRFVDPIGRDQSELARLFEPRVVYFESNSLEIQLTDELRRYLTEAIQYLKGNPDTVLELTGHTDGDGEEKNNLRLGLFRANQVAGLFGEFGLNEQSTYVKSAGEAEPIADNGTEQGKALNRRVEIRLTDDIGGQENVE